MVNKRSNKTPGVVRNIIESIPKRISGELPERYGIHSMFWASVAWFLYDKIHEAYIRKSKGGTDELGNSWPDITQNTKAKRPISKGELKGLGLTKLQSGTSFKDRTRGLLTPDENTLWKKIYSWHLSRLILTSDVQTAKVVAAKIAWATIKSKGAVTRKELLGNRSLLIMRVTDQILNSLEPSSLGSRGYRPRKNQIYEQLGNTLTIGTTVEYAVFHNKKRPVMPDNLELWVDQAVEFSLNRVIEHVLKTAV